MNRFQIKTENCGKGNGYLSMVLKLSVEFEGRPDFNFVLKIPMPGAMTKMIDGEKKEEEKDSQEPDENAKTIINGHNLECEFYDRFGGLMEEFPMPNVYYSQKIRSNTDLGLILMEDLSDGYEILGLGRTTTSEQLYSVARAITQFQFYVEKQGQKHRDWWMGLETNLHLDAFYSSWMPVGMEAAKELGRKCV
jgi:hypothetical protein